MKAYVCKCLCVFFVAEVLFLCFLGWENGNNGRIVLRVGKEDGGVGVDEEERGGEDRRQEMRAEEKGERRRGEVSGGKGQQRTCGFK